jgi:hypothetical protein
MTINFHGARCALFTHRSRLVHDVGPAVSKGKIDGALPVREFQAGDGLESSSLLVHPISGSMIFGRDVSNSCTHLQRRCPDCIGERAGT